MLDTTYLLLRGGDPSNNSSYEDKHTHLRYTVASVCFLSMIGSLLIILSYVCIKEIRTKTRQILVHLSLADFGVACSNLIGTTVYFDNYLRDCPAHTNASISCGALSDLCKTQAFFAGYCTLASILWTLILAVYIYCLIVHSRKHLHLVVLYSGYVICWGMPLLITAWLLYIKRLGYAVRGSAGWCSLIIGKDSESFFVVIFANDLWIYLTFILVTILYLSSHCYLRFQARDTNPFLATSSLYSMGVTTADKKFLFIPFAFLFLRIWSIIVVFQIVYLKHLKYKDTPEVLLFLSGIGDSAQGLVNAILFCFFTPKVRDSLLCCCWKRQAVSLRETVTTNRLGSFYGSLNRRSTQETK